MEAVYFEYLHLRFDVTLARKLAENYEAKEKKPDSAWVTPFARTDPAHVPKEPVLFATVVFDGETVHILIDGVKIVREAVKAKATVKVIILSFADTMKVLTTHAKIKRQMKDEAKKIGLTNERSISKSRQSSEDNPSGSGADE